MKPDFIIYRVGSELCIAHTLPGELRIIARIEQASLSKRQQERYAEQIIDALNKEAK